MFYVNFGYKGLFPGDASREQHHRWTSKVGVLSAYSVVGAGILGDC